MTFPRIITEPLGGSLLSQAVAAGRAPATWYATRPQTADEWRVRASEVRSSANGIDWFDALMPALTPSGLAADRLHASAGGRGVVVTTGQQPGLFGGPIYTWSKALSALALADALERATGVPVAPVFWAATDDSDFAEASWTMVARAGGADELRVDGDSGGASMAQVPLGDISALLERLEQGAGSAAFREALELTRRAYRRGQTVGSAYIELLRGVLEPLGISVLDAAHPAVRRRAAPHLRAALHRANAVADAVSERDRTLLAAGHSPQVAGVAGLSLVFATKDGVRQRIRNVDAPAVADAEPDEALSPNVLLRPIIERSILPTVAYVAGPAELAYFAQTGAAATALDVSLPLAVPRWSCTILEPHVANILDRLSLDVDDLRDPHAAETRLAREALPAELSSAIARMRSSLDEGLAVLERHGDELVPASVIVGAARTIAHRVLRMERRFVAANRRRIADSLAHVATARGSLFPHGKRQERALNLVPLLARYGPPLLDAMLGAARIHADWLVGGAPKPAAANPESRGLSTPTP